MGQKKRVPVWNTVVRLDCMTTLIMNRCLNWPGVQAFFAFISRLGNGRAWYGLMLALPVLKGREAVPVVFRMAVSGVVTLCIYKMIKSATGRARPNTVLEEIVAGTTPLDQYSFPSGHTMHACAFSFVAMHHYPSLGVILVPFVAMVSLSRVILGLHYPTDVLIGAILGSTISAVILELV